MVVACGQVAPCLLLALPAQQPGEATSPSASGGGLSAVQRGAHSRGLLARGPCTRSSDSLLWAFSPTCDGSVRIAL